MFAKNITKLNLWCVLRGWLIVSQCFKIYNMFAVMLDTDRFPQEGVAAGSLPNQGESGW